MTAKRPLYLGFEPPGPKARAWLKSINSMSFIQGPVGSGKTTTAPMKCLEVAKRMHRSTVDIYRASPSAPPAHRQFDGVGWRKCRIVCVRMNYRRMWDTVLPSYRKVLPVEKPSENPWSPTVSWTAEKNGPADHVMEFIFQDAGPVRLHIQFRSVGEQDLESFIRGFEPDAWWLNEADELPPGALGLFYQRCGRAYVDELPDDVEPAQYSKVFGDINAPDEDNWFNQDYIQAKPDGFELFKQPSGFSPEAENMKILRRIGGENYYQDLAQKMRADKGEWAVKRFIENIPGVSRHGEPVYPEFNPLLHVSQDVLTPEPQPPIILGVDQGGTPAASFQQTTGTGRLMILNELVTPQGTIENAEEFGRSCGRLLIANYPLHARAGNFKAVLDPAAKQRGHDARRWSELFMKGLMEVTGYAPVTLAPDASNNIGVRVGWLKAPMRGLTQGSPDFLVSKNCRWHIRGLAGGYKLVRVQGKDRVFRDKPDKGPYSHLMNGAEYGASEYEGNAGRLPHEPVTNVSRPFAVRRKPQGLEPVQVVMSDADL